jgi:antitoxin component YwqK of YwqJK toxin-antitoxin module
MVRGFVLSASLLLLAGCQEPPTQEPRVYNSELFEREGVFYAANEHEPFSGTRLLYYESGALRLEAHYQDGLAKGRRTFWFANGKLEYEENYKDGKQEGTAHGWHENGQLQYEVDHMEGKEEILVQTWSPNGQFVGESCRSNGLEVDISHCRPTTP